MAKHRAPTQVQIASTQEESALQQWVNRHWKTFTGLAVAAAAGILLSQYMGQQSREAELQSWRTLAQDVTFSGVNVRTPSAAVLGDLATELGDGVAGPWAKALQVGEALRDEDFDSARRALDELEATYPDHPVVTEALYPVRDDAEGPHRTLRQHVEAHIPAIETWEAAHPTLFENPPLPEDAPRVKIVTDQGEFVLAFYSDHAPAHTENFLKLCREGFYDGTKFHRVIQNQLIQGGDPNTKEEDKTTWGQGGPGYTQEPEIGKVWHFPLAVAAAKKPGDDESSGSQFYIMSSEADVHYLDGDYTVFGMLVEGASVVDTLAAAPAEGESPTNPATIQSTEILE